MTALQRRSKRALSWFLELTVEEQDLCVRHIGAPLADVDDRRPYHQLVDFLVWLYPQVPNKTKRVILDGHLRCTVTRKHRDFLLEASEEKMADYVLLPWVAFDVVCTRIQTHQDIPFLFESACNKNLDIDYRISAVIGLSHLISFYPRVKGTKDTEAKLIEILNSDNVLRKASEEFINDKIVEKLRQ